MTNLKRRYFGVVLVTAAMVGAMLAPEAWGACNSPASVIYTMDVRVGDVQSFYCAGEDVSIPVIVATIGDPAFTGTQPVRLMWGLGGAVSGSINIDFGVPYTITIPSSALTPGSQELRIVARNIPDDYFPPDSLPCIALTVVRFTIIKVDLFRDEACTKVLDDWPVEAGKLRSPKYIFGKEDNIFIRVMGPSGLGNSHFVVQAKSESDTTGVPITLREISPGVYRNSDADGELLRLKDSSGEGAPADFIKVVDEEILTFTLEASGSEVCHKDVMVDRGEFATATARSYDSKAPYQADWWNPFTWWEVDRTPIWKDSADEFVSDINDAGEGKLDWWEAGNVRGSYAGNNTAFDSFVKASGGGLANHLETDVFYTHSHGNHFGHLSGTKVDPADATKEVRDDIIIVPGELAGVWSTDADWAIIKACSILMHDNVGRDRWETALKNGRRAHGILSFEDPSVSDYDGYVDDFFDEIGARHSIISSWINANSGTLTIDQPYGIVYHTENAEDYLRKAEEGLSLTADVTTDNFSYTWRDKDDNTGTDSALVESEGVQQTYAVRVRGSVTNMPLTILGSKSDLETLELRSHIFPPDALQEAFDVVRIWDSGRVRASKEIDLRAESINAAQARTIVSSFMKQEGFPQDAKIAEMFPVHSVSGAGQEQVVAYVVSMEHKFKSVAIAGDKIKMVVQRDGVKVFSAYWHDVRSNGMRRGPLNDFKREVLSECLAWHSRRFDNQGSIPTVKYVRPAYYTGLPVQVGQEENTVALLVWDVALQHGLHIYYEPATKKVLDHFEHDRLQKHRRKESLNNDTNSQPDKSKRGQ